MGVLAISASCVPPPAPPPPPPVAPQPTGPAATVPTHALTADQPSFLRLNNMPQGRTPIRIGVLLPFSNGSPSTRALAAGMMKSAEMALFEAKNPDLVLISADEGSTPTQAASAARSLLAQGAEVIVGPLFAQSALAVAPLARDHAVPVISFSTDRTVAGDGIYLLSFQPETEVHRIVSYAASQGHLSFAALVPDNAYGARVSQTFRDDVKAAGGQVTDVEKFTPSSEGIVAPVRAAAASKPDAILIAQGGSLLSEIGATLATDGANNSKVKFLGTGLWDDPSIAKEPMLSDGWFAAPSHEGQRSFDAKYKASFGSTPPQLGALAYDAVSLVALLASGTPYHRFTAQALTDPNGFAGVNGIFRFNPDGTSDRGLAVLDVEPTGFHVISPAPTTYQKTGS